MPPNLSTQGIELALQQIALAMNPLINPSMIIDGWIPLLTDTWTYLSATTITVPAGASGRYAPGDKIRIVQSGTTKYFYVVSLTDTILTVTGGTDYTVANATITSPAFSKDSTPIGFPHFFNYTPTWTGITPGNGVNTEARFAIVGKMVIVRGLFTCGTTSSGTTGVSPVISYPVTASSYAGNTTPIGRFRYGSSGAYSGYVRNTSTTTATLVTTGVSGANVIDTNLPVAIANTYIFSYQYEYELA